MKRWIFLLILFFAMRLSAQENSFIERVIEVSSKESNPAAARREMLEKATEQVSQEFILELIGEAKASKNKGIIRDKVMRHVQKFIPFSKPGEVQTTPEGFKMNVTLKVNLRDLQTLLRGQGLFYENESAPVVIPSLRWVDRVSGKSYAWWTGENESNLYLQKISQNFEIALRSAFTKNLFYFIRPQALRYIETLPQVFRTETLRIDDWQVLAPRYGAQVALEGVVTISPNPSRSDAFIIDIRASAIQVMNGREIAEIVRQFETQAGQFEVVVDRKLKEVGDTVSTDLSSQVLDAWQKGAIGASLYRLSLRGKININQQEAIKEIFRNKIKGLRNINERLIAMDGISFEIDSAMGPQEIGQKYPRIEGANFVCVLDHANEREAFYKIVREEEKK